MRRLLVAASVAGSLAACSTYDLQGGLDDVYVPDTPYDRYPITVTRGTVKLQVATGGGNLTLGQENAVVRFGQQARDTNAGHVIIARPIHVANSAALSARVAAVLKRQGVPDQAIDYQDYEGGRGAPIVVSFSRAFASTPECGDWSENLATSPGNTTYPNFGCAQQHNIAAMVANPEDIAVPRNQTPSDAMRRSQVFTDYRKPQDTATPVEDSQKAEIAKSVSNQ